MKLEELARQSSDAARASVVHLDPPPIGEAPRPSWHIPALVAAAALVLVAGVATALLLTDGDGGGDGETIVAGIQDVPRLGLPELSAWSLTAAMELPLEGASDGPQTTFDYYGDADADDPFADGGLVVASLPGTVLEAPEDGLAQHEIRGTTGISIGPDDNVGLGGATVLQWVESREQRLSIALGSRSMGVEELIELANALTIDIAGVTGGAATVTLPDSIGLDLVARTNGTPFQLMRDGSSGSPGWVVAYQQGPDERQQSLVLGTQVGDFASEAAAAMFWSSNVREVRVGDEEGFEVQIDASSDQGPTAFATTVLWQPKPGVVASLTHTGFEPIDDLPALAARAAELDDDTWEQYVSLARQVDDVSSGLDTVFGQGDGSVDGQTYSWTLGLSGGDLCFFVRTADGEVGSCQPYGRPDLPAGTGQTLDTGSGPEIGHALIAAAPDVEAVRLASGTGTIDMVEADAIKWFVWIGPSTQVAPENQPTFELIVDGVAVDTLEAGAEGAVGEGSASADPIGFVAANPSARSLGIVEGFEPWISGSEAGGEFVLGRVDGDLCLVTDGAAPSAACHPLDDVVVFTPTETDEGIDVSHVFVTDQIPACMEVMGISEDTIPTSTTHWLPDRNLELIAVPGTSQGWQLFLQNPSTGDEVAVDLPEVDGAMPWPADLC